MKIGANITSLTAQRYLARAGEDVSTSAQRLASGQRINKASDDAAGLAISSSLNAASRIFTQGVRNLNDGLSAINISEGALTELQGVLGRVKELAAQGSNGSLSGAQRDSLQKEVTALQSEWNRIVESTSFNGQSLLYGENTRFVLQGGKGDEGTLTLQIGDEQLPGGILGRSGGTTAVSATAAGTLGNNSSGSVTSPSISADGQEIAFSSTASNFDTTDTNSLLDIFVKNAQTGAITRVSTTSFGAQGNGASDNAVLSANGRFVAFQSTATNLVATDSNSALDIFVKDRISGALARVSTSSSGAEGDGASSNASISADGRFVAFRSTSTNLVASDTNGASDIFLKDTVTGVVTLISAGSAGVQGNGNSDNPSISADGRFVAFDSVATNLVTGDTGGWQDIFIKDTLTGSLTRLSETSAGVAANGDSFNAKISADGRSLAFGTVSSNLITGDTNGRRDVYLKSLVDGATTRVSTSSSGVQGDQNAYIQSISSDARYIAFRSTGTTFVADDTNASNDIFVKDTLTNDVRRVSVDSAGIESNNTSLYASISWDGRSVAYSSVATNLVAGDTNGAFDIFLSDLSRTGIQSLAGLIVTNQTGAQVTLELVSGLQDELAGYRSKLGVTTSRATSFLNTLRDSTINYTNAASRIVDVDVAEEAAKSVAATIRQQVATSILSYASSSTELVLSLIR